MLFKVASSHAVAAGLFHRRDRPIFADHPFIKPSADIAIGPGRTLKRALWRMVRGYDGKMPALMGAC